jgi:hypothetical protein
MALTYECCHKCKPPKRHGGCHATCPDYEKAAAENAAVREKRRKEREIDNYTVAAAIDRHEKWRRSHE